MFSFYFSSSCVTKNYQSACPYIWKLKQTDRSSWKALDSGNLYEIKVSFNYGMCPKFVLTSRTRYHLYVVAWALCIYKSTSIKCILLCYDINITVVLIWSVITACQSCNWLFAYWWLNLIAIAFLSTYQFKTWLTLLIWHKWILWNTPVNKIPRIYMQKLIQ